MNLAMAKLTHRGDILRWTPEQRLVMSGQVDTSRCRSERGEAEKIDKVWTSLRDERLRVVCLMFSCTIIRVARFNGRQSTVPVNYSHVDHVAPTCIRDRVFAKVGN